MKKWYDKTKTSRKFIDHHQRLQKSAHLCKNIGAVW